MDRTITRALWKIIFCLYSPHLSLWLDAHSWVNQTFPERVCQEDIALEGQLVNFEKAKAIKESQFKLIMLNNYKTPEHYMIISEEKGDICTNKIYVDFIT